MPRSVSASDGSTPGRKSISSPTRWSRPSRACANSRPPRAACAAPRPTALAKAKELLAKHGREGQGFRVGVRGGGCSGLTYMLEFENEARKGDQVMEFDGLRIYLDIKSQLFLAGTTLDYTVSLMDKGFKFVNPNAKRSCSCGESFSV
jgi:iron-sulfur cluster assembly protein